MEKSAANHQEDGRAAMAEIEPPKIMDASAFHYYSLSQGHKRWYTSLFAAARRPYRLSTDEHDAMVALRGGFMDAYEATRASSNQSFVPTWPSGAEIKRGTYDQSIMRL